jgi:hypothetical protein
MNEVQQRGFELHSTASKLVSTARRYQMLANRLGGS